MPEEVTNPEPVKENSHDFSPDPAPPVERTDSTYGSHSPAYTRLVDKSTE